MLEEVLAAVAAETPELVVVDSIQTLGCASADGVAGGVTQVRAVTGELVAAAKAGRMACLLVGHVTKDGAVAGPRTIEHLVDAVILFEGDGRSGLRWLRAAKNRFGGVEEVGCFEMTPDGVHQVADPSGLFLEDFAAPAPGACAGLTLDGRRPMGLTVQALVAAAPKRGKPVRSANGLDSGRLAMVLAVLGSRCGIELRAMDVYVSTVGGIKCLDPAVDLTMALACVSAALGSQAPGRTLVIGEVGLGGQVRSVRWISQRLAEACRLGFTRALVPASSRLRAPTAGTGLELEPVGNVLEAVEALTQRRGQTVGPV
jgi:DNA repair protein RadA/Sms